MNNTDTHEMDRLRKRLLASYSIVELAARDAGRNDTYETPEGWVSRYDYFVPVCDACGWRGAYYSNRAVEGHRRAQRDADEHRCEVEPATTPKLSHDARHALTPPAEMLD